MSYLHDEQDQDDFERPREREVTLSTGTILGVFFGLALLCGAFFAFGYSIGNKAHPVSTAAAEGPGPSANFGAFKPPSGEPAMATANPPRSATDVVVVPGTPTSRLPAETPDTQLRNAIPPPPAPTRDSASANPAAPVIRPAPQVKAPVPVLPEPSASGSFVVQVAAVSHQEDAELLVNALHRKGYTVASRTEPQDKLFHIQVGPFASKKDADTMRQRLLSDGYNAILK